MVEFMVKMIVYDETMTFYDSFDFFLTARAGKLFWGVWVKTRGAIEGRAGDEREVIFFGGGAGSYYYFFGGGDLLLRRPTFRRPTFVGGWRATPWATLYLIPYTSYLLPNRPKVLRIRPKVLWVGSVPKVIYMVARSMLPPPHPTWYGQDSRPAGPRKTKENQGKQRKTKENQEKPRKTKENKKKKRIKKGKIREKRKLGTGL